METDLKINFIYPGSALKVLRRLPGQSVHCIVTSPPYYGLRDYGVPGQIGLEASPERYIRIMVLVFRECKRVLRDDGTLWLNIGDSYAGSMNGQQKTDNSNWVDKSISPASKHNLGNYEHLKQLKSKRGRAQDGVTRWGGGNVPATGLLKPKDLIGIPWMLAFALRNDGWFLRQDIIWHKPNPMPESVTDRCTKSHEYIFLFAKSKQYYYNHIALMQDVTMSTISRLCQDVEYQKGSDRVPGKTNGPMKARASWNGSTFDKGKTGFVMETNGGRNSGNKQRKNRPGAPDDSGKHQMGSVPWEGLKANKRSVWSVSTKPFSEAHFATFPEDLIVDCIKAGCPPAGVVLDPFMGAGTTALVASKLGRNFVGIELNPAYIKIAQDRLTKELGMFNPLRP